MNHCNIRNMTRGELDIALDWAANEGWNPGLYDRDCFYNLDPKGFFMGFLDNEPISCISAVKYGESFGFIGLYIVKPEYRKQGYGIQIWNHAIEYLGDRNIGLDGVLEAQEKYMNFGFKLYYRNIRFEGVSERTELNIPEIGSITDVDFQDLKKYDKPLFGFDRPEFLKCWINQPESKSFGFVEKGSIKGYGVIRKCRTGYKVGPLFADDVHIAENLLIKLTSSIPPGTGYFIDPPEPNSDALKLAKKLKLKQMFETARMYTKEEPKIELSRVFGISTFEVG